jgi:hypothetical protein
MPRARPVCGKSAIAEVAGAAPAASAVVSDGGKDTYIADVVALSRRPKRIAVYQGVKADASAANFIKFS